MGYLNGGYSGGSSGPYTPPVDKVKTPAPVTQPIQASLDPTNPVETVAAGIGGLFSGAVGAVKNVADFVGGVPVIGDVARAAGNALGAVGDIGAPGLLQVKDVAKGVLDAAMLPSKVVQTGAAALRASEIFGPAPGDIKNMMAGGANFFDVTQKLVNSNRAFSDNAAANLGLTIVTDPLNYLPIAKPFTLAKQASGLANVERVAASEAATIVEKLKAGQSVRGLDTGGVALEGAVAGTKLENRISKALIGSRITAEDMAFLDKWRIPAALHDATIGKMGQKFNALVTAVQAPVWIAVSKRLGAAPRTIIEGMSAAGRPEWSGAIAQSFGKGLSQTMVFTVGRLFSRNTTKIAEASADYVIKVVKRGEQMAARGELPSGTTGLSWAAKTLADDGVVAADKAAEVVGNIFLKEDSVVRSFRRQWIDDLAQAEAKQVAAEGGRDYKNIQTAGGIRLSDMALEAQVHISEGAYKLEGLSNARRKELFIEKGLAAIQGGSKERIASSLGGQSLVADVEQTKMLEKIWKDSIEGLSPAEQARHVQTMEIAAYGAQGTNAAHLRVAINAIKNSDPEKFFELTGQRMNPKKFADLSKLLNDPANAKFTRINLVKSDTLTLERLTEIQALAAKLESAVPLTAKDLVNLPEDLAAKILSNPKLTSKDALGTVDDLAAEITSHFPDFHLLVGRADQSIWHELAQHIDEMIKTKSYVTMASKEELAALSKILDEVAPKAGNATIKSLSAGKYSIGFAPESNLVRRVSTRVTGSEVDYVSESISPFLDSSAGLVDKGLNLTADSFARSPMRQLADRWLTPIASKGVEAQQLERTIRLVEKAGGSAVQGRRLFAAISETALKMNRVPRALAVDENILRDTMQKALGPETFSKLMGLEVLDTAVKGRVKFAVGNDPRRALMYMYAGSKDVVGATQAFTGKLKVVIPQLAIITDFMYPMLKFKLNPNFYLQEAVESKFFNRLRAIDRVMTAGPYEAKYGWARSLPYVNSKLGEAVGLAKLSDDAVRLESEHAALVLGQPGSVLRADFDAASGIIMLGGKMADDILATEAGKMVSKSWVQSFTRGPGELFNAIKNPYPGKQAQRNQMAMQLALDKVASEISTKFPQQWAAARLVHGTNDARTVMLHILRDQRMGYINPTRVIGAYRPRNFAFAEAGSVEAAASLRKAVDTLAEKFAKAGDTPEAIAAARADAFALKDLAEKSSSLGNESVIKTVNELIAPETANIAGAVEKLKSEAKFAEEFAAQTKNDFNLLEKAVAEHLDPAVYAGFTREKISSTLANFRSYGKDFPGMEQIIAKLRSGEKLVGEDIKILRYATNTLMELHGPEEMILMAMKETIKDTAETANRIHFYNPNRSALERTLNHPYLGFYPLSYTIGKIVPEFARAAFVKLPFTNATRPFAGYAAVRHIQDHIATLSQTDPKFTEWMTKSDLIFMLKQMFPGVPGDISVTGPRWVNRSAAQWDRSQRPGTANRAPAQFDPFYVGTQLTQQAKDQTVWGQSERWLGAGSEVLDYFNGPQNDFNPGP